MEKKKLLVLVTVGIIVVAVVAAFVVYRFSSMQTAWGCKMRGGTWTRYGLSPDYECLLKTKDAGVVCTDSSQCQGSCINHDPKLKRGLPAQGVCTGNNVMVGCFTTIVDGKAEDNLCID